MYTSAVIAGRGLHSSEMAELLHLLKQIGHAAKEAADRLLESTTRRANDEDDAHRIRPPMRIGRIRDGPVFRRRA
jgi:hypothetical protein